MVTAPSSPASLPGLEPCPTSPEPSESAPPEDGNPEASESPDANSDRTTSPPPPEKKITFKIFERYCRDTGRRADLYACVKHYSVTSTLPKLLRLYHSTNEDRLAAARLGTIIGYTAGRIGRFANDLAEFGSLTWDPERPRISLLLKQFASTAGAFQVQADFDSELAASIQRRFVEFRESLFEAIQDQNIEWIGRDAFIKHGYLMEQDCYTGNHFLFSRVDLSLSLQQLGEAWGVDLFKEERRWHQPSCQEDNHSWGPEDNPIPKHCYRDWYDPQSPPP